MSDLMLIETGNGGDLVQRGNDLALVDGVENMPYLGMFGGNDWWGNDLLLADTPEAQFKALTQDVLKQITLNSNGRLQLEQAIIKDLAFLKEVVPGTTVKVTVQVASVSRAIIKISIDGRLIEMYWHPGDEYLTYKV